jgi:hypothetical protein
MEGNRFYEPDIEAAWSEETRRRLTEIDAQTAE